MRSLSGNSVRALRGGASVSTECHEFTASTSFWVTGCWMLHRVGVSRESEVVDCPREPGLSDASHFLWARKPDQRTA